MTGLRGNRQIKTAREIGALRKAAAITKDIYTTIVKDVKPGVRESAIAKDIESIIKRKGLKRSFKTIVASGPNAARPHAQLTTRKIKKNDIVVIDFGVKYKGYHSDMTRSIVIGRVTPKIRRFYRTVKDAQKRAIAKVKPGVKISAFVRDVHDFIRRRGFGKYILHSLGHGVGRKIHESPKLSEKNKGKLKKGMVITIEPGLYINGRCGVRIEDMVLVNDRGCEVLTT